MSNMVGDKIFVFNKASKDHMSTMPFPGTLEHQAFITHEEMFALTGREGFLKTFQSFLHLKSFKVTSQ